MSSRQKDLPFWVAFSHVETIWPTFFSNLRSAFPSMVQAWRAQPNVLRRAGLPDRAVEAIVNVRSQLNVARAWREVERIGLHTVTIEDPSYPALLRHVPLPPPLLFVRGALPPEDAPWLAVVGTRRPSVYGIHVASLLVEAVAAAGATIVSGMAFGIDALAHRHCIDAGSKTVAVLGSGLDHPTPATHTRLAEEIVASGGCLLSEYSIGTPALPHRFPARNRIIAGLCRATLVIEGRRTSGSLITAYEALNAGRDVLAVPGQITVDNAAGPNALIRSGATPITSPADLLEALGLAVERDERPRAKGSPTVETILTLLRAEPLHIDEIVERSTLTPSVVSAALSDLELRGRVEQIGGRYILKQT